MCLRTILNEEGWKRESFLVLLFIFLYIGLISCLNFFLPFITSQLALGFKGVNHQSSCFVCPFLFSFPFPSYLDNSTSSSFFLNPADYL